MRASGIEVARKRALGMLAVRHKALLFSLSPDEDKPLFLLEVVQFDAAQLGYTQAGAVAEFEHGSVTFPQSGLRVRDGEQALHLVDGEDARNFLRAFWNPCLTSRI